MTLTFNAGSAWELGLIHAIVQFPVTSVDDNVYTWGPWTGALDPAEYRLDVTDKGDGTYDYILSGRAKTLPGAQFEVIIDGFADPRDGELQGNGRFTIDFDAGKRVNPIDPGDARGLVGVTYDLGARHLDLDIRTTNDAGQPIVAAYAYDEAADGSGDMVFDIEGDAGGGPADEQVTLRCPLARDRCRPRGRPPDRGRCWHRRDRLRVLGHQLPARVLHRFGRLRADRG